MKSVENHLVGGSKVLHVYFGNMKEAVFATSVYFDNTYEDEWFNDPFVKEMVQDIDRSEVVNAYCVNSPVLGQIPVTKLSGGVKTLILILKDRNRIFNASQCVDNCAKWLLKMSEDEDVYINLRHTMDFGEGPYEIYIDNLNKVVSNRDDFVDASIESRKGK